MTVNPIEYLEIRDKVQVNSVALVAGVAANIGPWSDNTCKQGLYYIWSDTECYFKLQSTAIVGDVTAETGIILNAKNPIVIQINEGDYLSVVGITGASGKLRFVRIRTLV